MAEGALLRAQLSKYLSVDLEDFYNSTDEHTKLKFNQFTEVHNGHHGPESAYVVVEFCGGLNGLGDWFYYMKDISVLFDILQADYDCWLVNLENDCLDDVFYLRIGIKKK